MQASTRDVQGIVFPLFRKPIAEGLKGIVQAEPRAGLLERHRTKVVSR
jgi:hypothetical protein